MSASIGAPPSKDMCIGHLVHNLGVLSGRCQGPRFTKDVNGVHSGASMLATKHAQHELWFVLGQPS